MSNQFFERDWKFMRDLKPELLNTLAERINQRSLAILSQRESSAHDRYRKLYAHVLNSDDIVAQCFDDWRRSTLVMRLVTLRRHGLLTDENLQTLSEHTRNTVVALAGMKD